jgi:predicted dehydrogenase
MSSNRSTRRTFLQTSGALAGAALASSISQRAYAGEDNTIKIALVGCGGRGNGAVAEALQTTGPTKLVAAADFFEERVRGTIAGLKRGPLAGQVDVPPDRQFVGLDAYKKAIDAAGPGGVVLLATPPAFRPIHVEHAVANGCHVFMEKSFAVDAPGIRRILKAGEEATKKNLKIAGGLRCRHDAALEEAIGQIQKGLIGDVISLWAYRVHGPVGYYPRTSNTSELGHQIRNYSCYTWLNGSFILDWLIHNLDNCCWIKGAWPVSAQGQGGRQTRTQADQLFDHYAVEYSFADGTRLMAQGRLMTGCWEFFGVVVHGNKGSAVLGEGQNMPRIFKGYQQTAANQIWKPARRECKNAYQVEHDLLFSAIRNDKPYNETEFSAKAAMTGILGRMAAESGHEITWDQAMASNLELAPGLDTYTMDSQPPVTPDAQGRYPIAMPGFTNVL